MSRVRLALALAVLSLALAPPVALAQTFQVAPFGGYRFGGDLYELTTGRPLDIGGAPSVGVTADLFVGPDTSVTFLYSRQQTHVVGTDVWGARADYGTLFVEHWQIGGTVEVDATRIVRPFLGANVGLTRFGGPHGSEARFSAGGGAGVKVMPSAHLGLRLDGRLYAVFADGGIGRVVCGGGGCLFNLDVAVVWQAELSAGLVLSF